MKEEHAVWSLANDRVKEPYNYRGCGLDDIWLVSGYEVKGDDGEQTVTIKNLDGLHKAIGASLVERKVLLTGKEIRFLRLQMDLTQSQLARLVGCDTQQIARYEKGENKMPGPMDRLLRMIFRCHQGWRGSVRKILQELDKVDSRIGEKQIFKDTPNGWKAAA